MEKRTCLTFSLRIDATEPMELVKTLVEKALDCPLRRGSFAGTPAMVGEILGMEVGLLLWRGIGGAHIYQLHGFPDLSAFGGMEWEEIRIDRAVIDLLRQRGAGEWRQPTIDEQKAAGDYDLDDI